MKLITKTLAKKIPSTYVNGNTREAGLDPMIYIKLFTPWSNWTWYISQYDPETGECFGLTCGFEKEWGYFSLLELEEIVGPAGLKIERDIHFEPCKYSSIKGKE